MTNREIQLEQAEKKLRTREFRRLKERLYKIVMKLVTNYDIEDIQELGLPPNPTPDDIYKWSLNYCHGLVFSECITKLEQEIAKHGYKQLIAENVKYLRREIRDMEKKAKELEKLARIFKLPVDIDEYTAQQLEELYKNPEMDHQTVKTIIYSYLKNLGYNDSEALQLAEESAKVIDKLVEKKYRHYATAEWTQILRTATKRAEYTYKKKREKTLKWLQKFIEKNIEEKGIYSLTELELLGFNVKQPEVAENIIEAENILLTKYNAEKAIIGSPATLIYFNPNTFCEAEKLKKPYAWIITKCNQPVLLYKVKDGRVYYQVIGGE